MTSTNDEECWRGGQREQDVPESAQERRLRELTARALARLPALDPRPSVEEVEAVFRAVIASY